MWPQEPGSLTRIIAAMVAPRNTSSETIRGGRGEPATAAALGATAGERPAIVSVVAMERPSAGREFTGVGQAWQSKEK